MAENTELAALIKAEQKARADKSYGDLEKVRAKYFKFVCTVRNYDQKRDAQTRMYNIDGTLAEWEDGIG